MAIENCRECGASVSSKAAACPKCQAPVKRKNNSVALAGLCIIVSVVGIGIILAALPPSGSSSPRSTSRASSQDVVLKSEYDQIRHGMSYRDVAAIIGVPGEEVSSGRVDGVPGVMEPIDTVMYSWQNRDGSNMNALFQNDKLVNKAQFGLK